MASATVGARAVAHSTRPPLETIWFRFVASVAFVAILINPLTRPGVLRSKRPWLQAVRSLLLFGSTLANFTALKYLQLAETTAIALAGGLLGCLAGFAGVAGIVRYTQWKAVVAPGICLSRQYPANTRGMLAFVLSGSFVAVVPRQVMVPVVRLNATGSVPMPREAVGAQSWLVG